MKYLQRMVAGYPHRLRVVQTYLLAPRRLLLIPLLWLCLPLAGCEYLGYYYQAASGQLSLHNKREAITELIENPDTAEDLRSQLVLLQELKAFAQSELLLPGKGQYEYYADLERDYVVWNVFIAPELSLTSKTWCHPIVGCVDYRGYFSEQQARDYAGNLATQGYDAYVGGVRAYSTLGWMSDPVLNTFVYLDETQLADLIFHELAHQQLYVPGDTVFNESFATAVAMEGVRRWLDQRSNGQQYSSYLQGKERQEQFIRTLSDHRQALASLYDSPLTDNEMRQGKGELNEQLQQQLLLLQQEWGSSTALLNWIEEPVNNARLNTVALYYDLVPGLQHLLAEQDYQLPGFYQRCAELAELDSEQRQIALALPDGADNR